MKHLVALLVLLVACDPQINITAPQSPQPVNQAPLPSTTPISNVVAPTPTKSCPVAVPLYPSEAVWTCTNNCTQVPFASLWLQLTKPNSSSPYGLVQAELILPNGMLEETALINNDRNHDLIVNGQLALTETETQPRTNTTYSASLDCDELTINGATFTYTQQID